MIADRQRVLLVEDDRGHADMVRRAFGREAGRYQLEVADSLAAARPYLGSGRLDLVIADLMLLDGRGTELLRSQEGAAPVPVIVLTSHGDETAAVSAMKAGALDYIVKSDEALRAMPQYADRALREWRLVLDRRRAEEALRLANESLERRVERRTVDLRSTVARLRDEIDRRRNVERELRDERRALQQLVAAHERDRKLIAYEIHDGLVQDLTGALLHLEAAQRKQGEISEEVEDDCRLAHSLLREAINEGRNLISGIRPPVLDDEGIVAAIEYLIAAAETAGGPPVTFTHDLQGPRLSPLLEDVIYRIVQESLTNVRKHSGAKTARVQLRQVDGRLHVEICDDGVGYDPTAHGQRRLGLRGIRERARAVHGSAEIDSRPGGGTCVVVDLPRWDAFEEEAAGRRRAEDTLRESEERFRHLVENIREVFWLTDWPENRVVYVSPAFERTWRRTTQSLYDDAMTWVESIHPEDRERVEEAFLTKAVEGEYDETYRIVRPDGSERCVHDRGFPIRDESGRVYRIAGIAEDVTEQRRSGSQ